MFTCYMLQVGQGYTFVEPGSSNLMSFSVDTFNRLTFQKA